MFRLFNSNRKLQEKPITFLVNNRGSHSSTIAPSFWSSLKFSVTGCRSEVTLFFSSLMLSIISSAPCRVVGRNTGTGTCTKLFDQYLDGLDSYLYPVYMIVSYRYRQRYWSGSDLGIHIHGHRNEDRNWYWNRNILPLNAIIYI